jgi:type VI secretion system protein ImpL
MTSGTDARRLFTTEEVVPGMFTRQAWEGGIQQAIEKQQIPAGMKSTGC